MEITLDNYFLLGDEAPDDDAETIEEKIVTENLSPVIKLDYKLKTVEERRDLVDRLIAQTP